MKYPIIIIFLIFLSCKSKNVAPIEPPKHYAQESVVEIRTDRYILDSNTIEVMPGHGQADTFYMYTKCDTGNDTMFINPDFVEKGTILIGNAGIIDTPKNNGLKIWDSIKIKRYLDSIID